MDTPVFLTYIDPAGAKRYIALELYSTTSTFCLPDVVVSGLSVLRKSDFEHSSIRLDIEQGRCLLSVFSDQLEPVLVLGDYDVEMPVSTNVHQKSIIITENHQFVTSAGRWQVEWDRSGDISNSMRPPSRPALNDHSDQEESTAAAAEDMQEIELVPAGDGERLIERQDLDGLSEEDENTPIPITEIRLSPMHSKKPGEGENDCSETMPYRTDDNGSAHSLDSESIGSNTIDTSKLLPASPEELRYSDTTTGTSTDENGAHAEDMGEDKTSIYENVTIKAPSTYSLSVSASVSSPFSCPEEVEEIRNEASSSTPKENYNSDECVDGHKDVPTRKDTARSQPVVRRGDQIAVSIDNDDVETASEDESQQQKDLRVPKRRLYDIEHGGSPLQSKKRKTNGGGQRSTFPEMTKDKQDLQDTVTVTSRPLEGTSEVEKAAKRVNSLTPRKEQMQSVAQAESRERRSSYARQTSKAVSTPIRRSSRQFQTPAPSSSAQPLLYDYGRPTVIFGSTSKIPDDKKVISIIEKLGGTVVTNIKDADVLCIGAGSLKKTSKFVIAVARGKDIVTDDWVRQAHTDHKFPDCNLFLPKDNKHEKEWGFSLADALDRGKQGLRILEGFHIYLTSQLCKDLGNLTKELKQVALSLGATSIQSGLPKKTAKHQVLVVGSTKNTDSEITKVDCLGHKLYSQDVLTMAALRGRLDFDSGEFVIDVPVKSEPSSSQ